MADKKELLDKHYQRLLEAAEDAMTQVFIAAFTQQELELSVVTADLKQRMLRAGSGTYKFLASRSDASPKLVALLSSEEGTDCCSRCGWSHDDPRDFVGVEQQHLCHDCAAHPPTTTQASLEQRA